jgi:plasmid stabilization system protein ParE
MHFTEYSIRYSDESIEDLLTIAQHYAEISLLLKQKLKDAVHGAETDLLRNPFAFSKIRYRDFRRILLKKIPYKIIYRTEENIIYVFAVFHQARSNRYVKRRLRK